jgi:hypothetical protein
MITAGTIYGDCVFHRRAANHHNHPQNNIPRRGSDHATSNAQFSSESMGIEYWEIEHDQIPDRLY